MCAEARTYASEQGDFRTECPLTYDPNTLRPAETASRSQYGKSAKAFLRRFRDFRGVLFEVLGGNGFSFVL
jgi:hypothetical protein